MNRHLDYIPLQTGVDHLLAIHLVDQRSVANRFLLGTESERRFWSGIGWPLTIVGPGYPLKSKQTQMTNTNYWSIWISTCAVLSIIFWFLYFQDRSARYLLLIALINTLFSIAMFCDLKRGNASGNSFNVWYAYFLGKDLFYGLSVIPGFIFFALLFRGKVSFPVLLIIVLLALGKAAVGYFYNGLLTLPVSLALILLALYFIIPSWKNLKGAQWAIVVGWVLTCVWNLLYIYAYNKYGPAFPYPYAYLYLTGVFLSAPLSEMVYVAMRFNEILNEVRAGAKQILKITEEKKAILTQQNEMLEKQVQERTGELRLSLHALKTTQSQLIQAEKMASLGELTAGIAHEIQNPLNFVNNFSEVNSELIDEMNDELDKGDVEGAKTIAIDIKQNLEKINHHGKRADAIVKGMLQHSRKSEGAKEPTDINALADEYLRLSYHGLRAKENSFNAMMHTDFDSGIGKIIIIPQDIGRVLLNLYNNAFYAVE